MTSQYVMANVLIPIDISNDKDFQLMPEYIKIHIERCDQLPEKQNLPNVQNTLLDQINDAIEKKRLEGEKVFVSPEKMPKKRPQNITFKRYSNSRKSRNTCKHYESDDSETTETMSDSDEESPSEDSVISETDKDVDSSQLQEVQELELADDQLYVNLKEDEDQDEHGP